MTDQPAAARFATADTTLSQQIRQSQQRWRDERDYLNQHRHQLTQAVDHLYPADWRVAGTRLMARPQWQPDRPVPLADVALDWRPDERSTIVDPVQPAGSEQVRPLREDGTRFGSYAEALAALRPPRLLENRTCYRILDADASGTTPRLRFGINRYFDLINVSEAVAHETAILARARAEADPGLALDWEQLPLRQAIGDPRDLAARSAPPGVCTLILRRDRDAGLAQMFLHWRDPARVAVNGGLYQVAPAGMFQPSDEAPWNLVHDLDLWRAIAREVSEELLGTSEDYGSDQAPIDYDRWPFYAALTAAREAGTLHGYWLGVGTDPLTLDVDLLTVLVFDAPFFDAEFGGLVAANDEGFLLQGPAASEKGLEFTAATIERFTTTEAMQPAGAAVLALAWRHRQALLDR